MYTLTLNLFVLCTLGSDTFCGVCEVLYSSADKTFVLSVTRAYVALAVFNYNH